MRVIQAAFFVKRGRLMASFLWEKSLKTGYKRAAGGVKSLAAGAADTAKTLIHRIFFPVNVLKFKF